MSSVQVLLDEDC